jgi:hypothetical protein
VGARVVMLSGDWIGRMSAFFIGIGCLYILRCPVFTRGVPMRNCSLAFHLNIGHMKYFVESYWVSDGGEGKGREPETCEYS